MSHTGQPLPYTGRLQAQGHVGRHARRLLDRQRRPSVRQRHRRRQQFSPARWQDEQLGGRHPRQRLRLGRLPAAVAARHQVGRPRRAVGLVRNLLRPRGRGRHGPPRRQGLAAADRLARPERIPARQDARLPAGGAPHRHRASPVQPLQRAAVRLVQPRHALLRRAERGRRRAEAAARLAAARLALHHRLGAHRRRGQGRPVEAAHRHGRAGHVHGPGLPKLHHGRGLEPLREPLRGRLPLRAPRRPARDQRPGEPPPAEARAPPREAGGVRGDRLQPRPRGQHRRRMRARAGGVPRLLGPVHALIQDSSPRHVSSGRSHVACACPQCLIFISRPPSPCIRFGSPVVARSDEKAGVSV
mmetsp:Transcript_21859/g.64086  ORF Transcript_21859/g.64086 Transcript_21859/m.64086 type:complete len:358 (-) Transcript_21859:81-1154(-)